MPFYTLHLALQPLRVSIKITYLKTQTNVNNVPLAESEISLLNKKLPIFPHFKIWRVSSTTVEVNSTFRELISVSKTGRVQNRPSSRHAVMISLSLDYIIYLSFRLHFSCLFLRIITFPVESGKLIGEKTKQKTQENPKLLNKPRQETIILRNFICTS